MKKPKNIIEYKGYYSKVDYSVEDRVLHGKIEGIADLVNFECENAEDVEREFREAVDDYLIFCEEVGKQPDKPYRGVFNIRLTPELHRQAAMRAADEGVTLNQFISTAVERQLLNS